MEYCGKWTNDSNQGRIAGTLKWEPPHYCDFVPAKVREMKQSWKQESEDRAKRVQERAQEREALAEKRRLRLEAIERREAYEKGLADLEYNREIERLKQVYALKIRVTEPQQPKEETAALILEPTPRPKSEPKWMREARERERIRRQEVKEQSLRRKAELDDLRCHGCDEMEEVPHVVRFGTFDGEGFGREHRSIKQDIWLGRGRHRRKAAAEMIEYLGQFHCRRHVSGRGPHNPQKQQRTWEAATPRKWRRKDQCNERWYD